MRYRGLTWDHPRGYHALAAAAATLSDIAIDWDKQPLEGFEAHPIADLCARYDLVVLDHPHVGEAVAADCLQPLEDHFSASEIAALDADSIGPSLASYRYAGRHWALPLDAATQVMARRADLIADAPATWDAVLALSGQAPVALSLAGPHSALGFQSIAAALGERCATADPDIFVSAAIGARVLDIMADLAARSPASVRALNPIGILGHMAANDDVALCPLIYGYVNYAAPGLPDLRPVAFSDAPRAGGEPGSTLGGTGIGISARCSVTPGLLAHLRWLMSDAAQRGFIPAHDGQPSRRAAWHDDAVNARWGDFYRGTAATLEAAYVRPRHDGAIAFQTAAAELIRAALLDRRPHAATLAALQDAYARSRQP